MNKEDIVKIDIKASAKKLGELIEKEVSQALAKRDKEIISILEELISGCNCKTCVKEAISKIKENG